MTVLITGNGHSGTTFIARLLMELGCDFGQGDPSAAWTQGAQAMEHPVIQRQAAVVARWVEKQPLRQSLPDSAAILEEKAEPFPPYVKAPAIGWHLDAWLELGFRADAVIVCHRNIDDTLKSIKRAGGGYGGFGTPTAERLHAQTGRLVSALWEHGIPHSILEFPYTITAPAWITCGQLCEDLEPLELGFTCAEFAAAHARIARPELVHFR